MRALTDKPFGVNIAHAFVRDPGIVEFVIDQGVRFVTTSAGDPAKYCARAEGRGAHGLPRRADPEGGAESGRGRRRRTDRRGRRRRRLQESAADVASMVLLPLVREKVGVPIIAAGGISDGRTMAAAFALGAEGVQMGTRMVSSAESPVHANWKKAILAAAGDRHGVPQSVLQAGAARAAHRRRPRGWSASRPPTS